MVCTHQLNLFPAKGGVSAYLGPHMLMTGRNLDFVKHWQVPFVGAYIQANQENDPTNTQAPRTIDAIYLRPMNNIQGGHESMNLQTGLVITRNKIWEQPISDLMIRAVETMASEQGITTLKITGRNKVAIYPADWIAGVGYQDEEDKEHEQPEDESDDQFDDELDDAEAYDQIDQGEINDSLSKEAEHGTANDANPIDREEDQEQVQQEQVQQEQVQQEQVQQVPLESEPDPDPITDDDNTVQTELSRPSRDRKEPDKLTFCQTSQQVAQT
jgi:hypothetical protein